MSMGEDDFIVPPFLSIRSSDQLRLNPALEDCRAAFLIIVQQIEPLFSDAPMLRKSVDFH